MVSYYQDSSGVVTLHPRETTSSGRPKPTHGPVEDAENFYSYTRTGDRTVYPKRSVDKYWDFLEDVAIYRNETMCRRGKLCSGTMNAVRNNVSDEITRLTPPTPFEIEMEYGRVNPTTLENPYHPNFIPQPTNKMTLKQRTFQKLKILDLEKIQRIQDAQDEADRLAELAEQERLKKLRETARPNPKEVEKVEPVEVEPIKEVEKYSPLMIAGVIAVVVILLLKRRRA